MASIGHVEEEGDPWNGRRTPRHLEAPKELAKPNKKLVLSFIRGRSMCVGLRNKVFNVFFKTFGGYGRTRIRPASNQCGRFHENLDGISKMATGWARVV